MILKLFGPQIKLIKLKIQLIKINDADRTIKINNQQYKILNR